MPRPIAFDLTHLVHRVAYDAPSGIDRVDLAYGRHFGFVPGKIAVAVHYAKGQPQVSAPPRLAEAVGRLEERWRETIGTDDDHVYDLTKRWLRGEPVVKLSTSVPALANVRHKFRIGVLPFLRYFRPKVLTDQSLSVPQDAIYLNIAQHALEHGEFFTWLDARRDLARVFFLHDLLPIDFPEFWWAGHEERFERRLKTMADHASALITSSGVVRDRAALEMKRRGKPGIPIFTHPLPSPIESQIPGADADDDLAGLPYFVIVGTIEPRKNHVLLLNIWRDLAARGGAVPKLVIVGKRGWENDQAVALIERCRLIGPHVLEVSGLSNSALRRLIANARALLTPSFEEGYGLPIVEALSLGAPVVASDIPVFRETAQEKAIFCSPIDGIGWRDVILGLVDPGGAPARDARALAAAYQPETTANYFRAVDAFLASL